MTYQEVINLENEILNTVTKPPFFAMSIELYNKFPKTTKDMIDKGYTKTKNGDWFDFSPKENK